MQSLDEAETADPLIVALRLDKESSRFFDRQRKRFFPPARNFLAAHVTLFHKLPGDQASEVASVLRGATRRHPAFPVAVSGLRLLGRGVAYDLDSSELRDLRGDLATTFGAMLTPQDRQGFRPHVTVQNKVEPQAARALFDDLKAGFAPMEVHAEGLDLYRYKGGPWEALAFFPFAGVAGAGEEK